MLTHPLCTILQLFYQIHTHTEIEWQIGILVCRIQCSSYKEIQIRTLFDQQPCKFGCTVLCIQCIKKCFIKIIILIAVQEIQRTSYGQYAFRYQIQTFHCCHWRNLWICMFDQRYDLPF